ncbi:MAG: O-antigen polymerase [Chitinophagales bacterium]
MISRKEIIVSPQLLKNLATHCTYLNLAAIAIFLGISLFADITSELAIACSILAIFISLFPVLYALIKKQTALLFTCISVLNIAPVWFLYLESVLPGYDAYTYIRPDYRVLALFWIAIFQFLVNFVYVLLNDKGHAFSARSFSFLKSLRFTPVFYIRMTFLFFIIPVIFFYIFYGSASMLWTAMTAGRLEGSSGLLIRDSVGSTGSLMLPLTWMWQLTPLFACIAFVSSPRRYKFLASVSLLLGLTVIFVYFLSGSRGSMIFVATPPLFFFFYYNWHRGLKFWVPASLLLIVFIGIMEIQVRFRGHLLEVIANPGRAAKLQGLKSITTFDPTQSQRDNNMYLFCLMVKSYPNKYAFEGFNDFFAVLVNPVPRSLWENKPVLNGAKDLSHQSSFVLSGPLTMGTTSLSFSIVGDAYKTSGLPGLIVYAFVYALFLLYFDGIIYHTTKRQPLSVAILGMALFLAFWGYRDFFALVSFLYPVLLLLIFFRLIKLLRTK